MRRVIELVLFLTFCVILCGCEPKSAAVQNTPETSDAQKKDDVNAHLDDLQNRLNNNDVEGPSETPDENTDIWGSKITYSFDERFFPLFAMIKSEGIYLYGVNPYGMVLNQNGKGTYFEWPGLTPRAILPEIDYCDYDGDGEKELAVALYVASGSDWSLMDLHILEIDETGDTGRRTKPEYTDYALLSNEIDEWFTEPIIAEQAADKKSVTVNFCGRSYVVATDEDELESGPFTGVGYGGIIHFILDEGEIKVNIVVSLKHENWAVGLHFGEIEAKVKFDGEKFFLSDYTLSLFDWE